MHKIFLYVKTKSMIEEVRLQTSFKFIKVISASQILWQSVPQLWSPCAEVPIAKCFLFIERYHKRCCLIHTASCASCTSRWLHMKAFSNIMVLFHVEPYVL